MDHNVFVVTVESGYSVKSGALRPQQKIIIIMFFFHPALDSRREGGQIDSG